VAAKKLKLNRYSIVKNKKHYIYFVIEAVYIYNNMQ